MLYTVQNLINSVFYIVIHLMNLNWANKQKNAVKIWM